jgi:hypothetical protein
MQSVVLHRPKWQAKKILLMTMSSKRLPQLSRNPRVSGAVFLGFSHYRRIL